MPDLDVVGKHAVSVGSRDIVTGRAKYTPDLSFPGMLVGRLLYTAHPHARIIKLDVSKARSLPGVVSVLTHQDIPGENSYNLIETDQPILVEDIARFQGDVLAAVAAEDEDAAQAALDAIEVEYEPLPGIFDPVEAMKPGAPKLWPDRDNVYDRLLLEYGDVDAGFKEADIIIDNTYATQLIEHAFLEPEGAVARVEDNGVVVVYAGCQAPFHDRQQIARSLAVPENMVRVIVPYIGGAFGGKWEIHVQIYTALLAQATGRPVRLIRTREESILTHVKRHPVTIRYRTGAKKDGVLTAIQVEAIGDTGPYVNAGALVMDVVATHSFGPYVVPNAHLVAYTVLTNNPIAGAMRGFGMLQAHLACERQMDELAKALGIDPLEIRLRNGLDAGREIPTGVSILNGDSMKACLKEASQLSGWEKRGQEECQPAHHLRRGWGVGTILNGFGMGHNAPDSAGIQVDMALDGSVIVRTGAVDYGQGLHTILAQLTAESLGVPLSSVKIVRPDTDMTSDAGATIAARQSFVSGNAALRAVEPIRRSLLETAEELTGIPREMLALREGALFAEGERLSFTTRDLATKAWEKNRQLCSMGYYGVKYPDGIFSESSYANAGGYFTFSTEIAKVLVDIETGEVIVEELVIVTDAGKVLNPRGAQGQIEGGALMGCGCALMEELIVDQGRTLNTSLASYLIPTSSDVPMMKIKFLESPEPEGPYGARGMGETGIIHTPAAILNAVSDAIGVSLNTLPITPERVYKALEANEKGLGE